MNATDMEWIDAVTIAGAPPTPREDAGCGYHLNTCNMIFFGGWRQKYLDDLWILNVAGVVEIGRAHV